MRTQLGFLIGVLICAAASAASSDADSPVETAGPPAGTAQLEEIVVTSQRRAENLQDVPVSVTAYDQSSIAKFDITDVRDIARLTPGLDTTVGFGGQPEVSIRGIIWNVGAATTGIYIDDTPIQVRMVGQGGNGGKCLSGPF